LDFTFEKKHELLRRTVREFAQQEIAPRNSEIEETHAIPVDLHQQMAELGFFGVPFPTKYGGAGAGETGYCIVMEELGKVNTSTSVLIGAHTSIGAKAIYLDGSERLKQKYLQPLCKGEMVAAFALTEPNAGSDAASIGLSAVREGDSYILDGSKIWITNGADAKIFSVFAVTDKALGYRGGHTAFVVEKGFPGFSLGTIDEKMGIVGSSTAELVFDGCRVPAENVIGQVGMGFLTAMRTLDHGRLGLGAGCLGGAQGVLESCLQYAKYREQFGVAIAQKQAIQFMIADIITEIEALRSLVYRGAWLADSGRPYRQIAGICKLFASEVSARAVDRAVQIHGALGYMRDYPVERMYRDARITEIFEGTSEIQRVVIAMEAFRKIGVRTEP
jgi:alkylation response protein AidB-like acyl-CoA dehydrogenase